jgi:hexosaminidase
VDCLIPAPASLTARPDESYELSPDTAISIAGVNAEQDVEQDVEPVAVWLADLLRRSTGLPLPIARHSPGDGGGISLALDGPSRLGAEGYLLDVADSGVRLRAHTPTGLFRGVQTLRQLLPPQVEAAEVQPGPWSIPGVRIDDRPRFGWRGVMLDVARHFFPVETVQRFIDLAAPYKINTLHLHLTDDQGWRIAVDRWPRLASYGGGSEVGGGPGGHYSKADYAQIVRYAAAQHMTVVPEIDVPGHTNAALASYPELNGHGPAPERYTGIEVGFSSLVTGADITYRFLDDVVEEVAALTPGPYVHLGGDEAHSTDPAGYRDFIRRAEQIVRRHGKTMVGWQEVAAARISPATLVQYWQTRHSEAAQAAVRQGAKLILSPATHAYLDIKYDAGTRLGLDWAGLVDARQSYDWDPATLLDGIGPEHVAGVEAALWTETITTAADIEYMTIPRLSGIAEIGWSPPAGGAGRSWADYRTRLAAHAARWAAAGVAFHRSADVPWPQATA